MACDIIIQLSEDNSMTIASGIDPEVEINFEDILNAIVHMSKAERERLADGLLSAKRQTLSEEDVKKRRFISNTSFELLHEVYPELRDKYPDLDASINDNYTMVLCNKIQLNGKVYSGRVVNSDGKEVFIITDRSSAHQFFKYVDTKNKLKKFITKNEISEELQEHIKGSLEKYKEDLSKLASKYKTNIEELIYDFLNNRSRYSPYKEKDTLISPSKIIYKFLSEITDNFSLDNNVTDFQLSMQNNKNVDDSYSLKKLWSIFELHYGVPMSYDEFLQKESSEKFSIIKNILKNDARWAKARVKTIKSGDIKTVEGSQKKINKGDIKEIWKAIKKEDPSLKLGGYDKMIKDSPEVVKALVTDYLNRYGFVDSEGEKHAKFEINLVDNKLKITYNTTSKSVRSDDRVFFEFPYNVQLGNIYEYAYDSDNLFEYVESYNGGMIYKYHDENITHYIVSRHILSAGVNTWGYTTLEAAREKIDRMNSSEQINQNGMWSLRQKKNIPRQTLVELSDVNVGQLITMTDIKLPSIQPSKMAENLRNLFYDNINNLHKTLSNVENITKIDNPEKAAAFVILLGQTMKKEKFYEFDEVPSEYFQEIINDIEEAGRVDYLVENIIPTTNGKLLTLREISDSGDDIQLSNAHKSYNSGMDTDITEAVNYFKESLGVNIESLPLTELLELDQEKKWGLQDILPSTKAFINNGTVYINKSISNSHDLIHEIAHIFMGVLKVKYPEAYIQLLDQYQKHRSFQYQFREARQLYGRMAQMDIIEEAVAELIAQDLYKNQSYLHGFDSDIIESELTNVYQKINSLIHNSSDSGLSFSGFIKQELTDSVSNEINKRRQVSQLIKRLMGKEIKQYGC